jgi:hypothetical protein
MKNCHVHFLPKLRLKEEHNDDWTIALGMHNLRAAERLYGEASVKKPQKKVVNYGTSGGRPVKTGRRCDTNLDRAAQLPFSKGSDKSSLGYRAELRRRGTLKSRDDLPVKSPVKAVSRVPKGRRSERAVRRKTWFKEHLVKVLPRSQKDRGYWKQVRSHHSDCPLHPGVDCETVGLAYHFSCGVHGRTEKEEVYNAFTKMWVPKDSCCRYARFSTCCLQQETAYRVPSKPRNWEKDTSYLYRKFQKLRKATFLVVFKPKVLEAMAVAVARRDHSRVAKARGRIIGRLKRKCNRAERRRNLKNTARISADKARKAEKGKSVVRTEPEKVTTNVKPHSLETVKQFNKWRRGEIVGKVLRRVRQRAVNVELAKAEETRPQTNLSPLGGHQEKPAPVTPVSIKLEERKITPVAEVVSVCSKCFWDEDGKRDLCQECFDKNRLAKELAKKAKSLAVSQDVKVETAQVPICYHSPALLMRHGMFKCVPVARGKPCKLTPK